MVRFPGCLVVEREGFVVSHFAVAGACRTSCRGRAGQRIIDSTAFRLERMEVTGKLTVHDPRGFPPKVTGKRLAPRLESLEGKVVYLVDCLFDNSDVFMAELKRWFNAKLPAVGIRTIRPKESWVDDPEMRAAMEKDGDAAILGVGL